MKKYLTGNAIFEVMIIILIFLALAWTGISFVERDRKAIAYCTANGGTMVRTHIGDQCLKVTIVK
jgi:hypothetical protein